ncbi:MAG: hypothetical protein KBE65_09540 [Phycisphaerae bacterium]|nr:hypothetical protein [Phycisphaerae bacterium]
MRSTVVFLVLLPLLIGGAADRPQSYYPNIEDCPFPVDPNLVVGRLLGWVRVGLGEELIHTRAWYDPNGDLARVDVVSGPDGVQIVNRPKAGSYTLLWKPTEVQTCAIVVRVTDMPPAGQAKSDTGTLLVQVVPRGNRPTHRACGGPPR